MGEMKALLMVLLPVFCFKGSLNTPPSWEPVKSITCYECSQSGSYKCDNVKVCNSTSGLCQLITYERKDGEKRIRQFCANDCKLPTSLFIDAVKYHALCCSFAFCNSIQYYREVTGGYANIAVSGFTTNLFWVYFKIILLYIELAD